VGVKFAFTAFIFHLPFVASYQIPRRGKAGFSSAQGVVRSWQNSAQRAALSAAINRMAKRKKQKRFSSPVGFDTAVAVQLGLQSVT
jgi:hypothetical protein